MTCVPVELIQGDGRHLLEQMNGHKVDLCCVE